jgi:NADP-dependent 3-hydroxy acid dehydrogenase YdfG
MNTDRSIRRAFEGRVAIVTGAGSGIGLAMARQLAAAGARVHALDRDQGIRAALAAGPGDGGPVAHLLDVTDAAAFGRLVEQIVAAEGGIDFLFNNAGVTLLGEAHKLPFARWRWLLDVNVMGVVHGIAHVYPRMVARGCGQIVNTASIAGVTGYPTAAAYTMSKACILELTRSLRAEARDLGVQVSAACPGYVRTNIFSQERTVGANVTEVLNDLPAPMMDPGVAAAAILRGTARGRATIIFPFSSRLLCLIAVWCPGLLRPLHARLFAQFR